MEARQRREQNRSQKDDCEVLLTKSGRVNQRKKMSALLVACENFVREHADRMRSVTQSPFLALGANPSPCLFVCSTLSVVLCVSVKKCVMPLVGGKRN